MYVDVCIGVCVCQFAILHKIYYGDYTRFLENSKSKLI